MKPILTAAVLILSLLLAPQILAALPFQATLTLPHNDVLPGVPFDLVVTYTNISNKPITIDGAGATLVVTFVNGDTVVMHESERNDQSTIEGSMPVRLAPGDSVQHAASWEDGLIPNWFHYGSPFSGPGVFEIALELRVVDEDHEPLGTVRTPPATLHRVEPVGIDAVLWKRMLEVSGGKWSDSSFMATKAGNALANEIIQIHPSSGYYPYVVAFRAFQWQEKNRNSIPILLEAAERFPSSPAYPYLLSAAADCARAEGLKALRKGNLAEAKEYYTLAETKYREALATKSVAIRRSSERRLLSVAHGLERAAKKRMR